ncbi:MAG: carbohydrate ABC transporter permease [Firmicutes bacterium]|nr:carbohydrate ABC transporter permease [Bacillota bacterium]
MAAELGRKLEEMPEVRRKSRFLTSHFYGETLWALVRAILVAGICYIIIYPLLIKLSSSMMTENDMYDMLVKWIPRKLNYDSIVQNYSLLYGYMNYPKALFNSLILAATVALLQMISSALIGYGFARFDFFGKNLFFTLVILTLLVPPQMIMVPLFLNFRFFDFFGIMPVSVNLLGTYWPFILTSITGMGLRNGFFIYIMRQVFKGLPKSLEEAALVDGAGYLRTFATIMVPGAASAMLVVFLFAFVWQYNDYQFTRMYLSGSATFLPFALEQLTRTFDVEMYSKEYISILNNTGMIMFIAPLLLLYAFLQRYFIESIERTGIVG